MFRSPTGIACRKAIEGIGALQRFEMPISMMYDRYGVIGDEVTIVFLKPCRKQAKKVSVWPRTNQRESQSS